MFKVGDKVRCINPRDLLVPNRVYTVTDIEIEDRSDPICYIGGSMIGYFMRRFVLVEPAILRGLALQVKLQEEILLATK